MLLLSVMAILIATVLAAERFSVCSCTKDLWFESLSWSLYHEMPHSFDKSWQKAPPMTISQRPLVDLNKAFKALHKPFPHLFPMWFLHIFYSGHRGRFLKHLCFSAHTIAWCGTHCLFFSSPLESEYSLHLSCFMTCPQATSDHRNHSLLWNALALTILVIHLQLVISSCLAILLYCCTISCIVL